MPFTRLSFYHFPDRKTRWWAFKQMREAHASLSQIEGLKFYKLLGSGAGEGFSIKPDWSVYAFLQVWEDEEAAERALNDPWLQVLQVQCNGQMHFKLSPYHSKGTWNGKAPFEKEESKDTALMAVITRASIKWTHLIPFWLAVPAVSRIISKQKSLLFQKGVGEWPLIEQATFSVWDREAAMKDFAYQQKEHREVVQKTRKLKWYREEQFSRFAVVDISGDWPNPQFKALQERLQP